MKGTVGFLGGGKMAEAILSGMLSGKLVEAEHIIVCERSTERLAELIEKYDIFGTTEAAVAQQASDLIIIAVKPQDVPGVLENLVFEKAQLVVSIAAGLTLAKLRTLIGKEARLVRVMPNLALAVGEGMCAYCDDGALQKDKKLVEALFGSLGAVSETPEDEFDAVTALSGSGPAFIAAVLGSLAAGAGQCGMDEEVAEAFALQTLLGTATYLMEKGVPLEQFIADVSSKGGTTEAGMEVLRGSDMDKVMKRVIAAAAKRSRELRRMK